MAKRIICNLPVGPKEDKTFCHGIVGHKVSEKMVDVRRQNRQYVKTYGDSFSQLITCPRCKREHTITVKKGVMLMEEAIKLEDIPPEDPNDPNDPNNHKNPPEE